MITNESNNLISTSKVQMHDESHELTVTIGDESIKNISFNYSKDSISESEKDIFKSEQLTLSETKYIEINKKITLDFGKVPPDNVTVKDILLNSEGGYLYPDKLSTDISLTNEDDKFSFLLQKNPASLLNSKFDNTRIDFRGFKIIATWGLNKVIYAFVIKADAY
ncbi:hypothetical protein [Paenibacillus sp. sgz500958]|uniref:hypothetical protein n=1 Tax=Paenibacillus sp. sgz500958 TaxID=3242475 RepID=UPI0036D3062E